MPRAVRPPPADVLASVEKSRYGQSLRKVVGDAGFADEREAFDGVLEALETHQRSCRDFYPYSSQYDAFLAGETALTARERRGRLVGLVCHHLGA